MKKFSFKKIRMKLINKKKGERFLLLVEAITKFERGREKTKNVFTTKKKSKEKELKKTKKRVGNRKKITSFSVFIK